MDSKLSSPVNRGSEETALSNQPAEMASEIAHGKLRFVHIQGRLGARGRDSDNALIREKLGWTLTPPLRNGLGKTYEWIAAEVACARQPRR
jgi:nucleoside-diphosphate-sugar epimerase